MSEEKPMTNGDKIRAMTDKENLTEILRSAIKGTDRSWNAVIPDCLVEAVAENLLAHGVTVQRWIPVTERLPKNGERVLAHLNSGSTYIADFDNSGVFPDWHKPNSNRLYCYVTHWMPLPSAPKGE